VRERQTNRQADRQQTQRYK